MADDWRPNETLSEERESQQPEQAQCKPLKESNNEKFDHEENSTDDWRRRPLNDTPSEGSLVATSNESGSTVSDADRERSSESSVISERYDDRTFEGEELDEGYEEKAINEADFEADEEFVDESYWNEILAKEAEQALQRSHISHPAFFLDDSTRFGPNVTVLSSTTSNDNLEFAIKTAAKTLERYANNQMLQARLIKKHCEEQFGTFWHCVTTSGNMAVFSRNEEHIHFVFKQTTIYLFRHEPYEPDAAHIKRMKNPDKTVMQIPLPSSDQCTIITNGMNLEKQQYAIRLAINALESMSVNSVIPF
ncbi:unnamed protein product [Anisakis simplex]|uniref:Uncharacterized protein n=1 Tax=Anisakis simplex TaxID=6269 RepID=A0A0M3KER2_ANISI|nr:unnamed protein product [Anisakis simplex]